MHWFWLMVVAVGVGTTVSACSLMVLFERPRWTFYGIAVVAWGVLTSVTAVGVYDHLTVHLERTTETRYREYSHILRGPRGRGARREPTYNTGI